jgi:F5/8 type C domain
MSACAEKGLSMSILLVLLLLLLVPVPGEAVTLSWDYGTITAPRRATAQKPQQTKPTAAPVSAPGDTFVVARSLNGGSWGDIGTVPLRLGTNITYEDTTLPAARPVVVRYRVRVKAAAGDSKDSNWATITLGGLPRLPVSALTAVAVDSEETVDENAKKEMAVDGRTSTFWTTAWPAPPGPSHPHWIVLDLGQPMMTDGLSYARRTDAYLNGTIAQFEIALSLDRSTWPAPVQKGTWTWSGQAEEFSRWAPTQARYVRLRALSEVNGGPWTSAAEVGVFAGPVVEPPPVQPPVQPPDLPTPGVAWTCTVEMPTPTTRIMNCEQKAP